MKSVNWATRLRSPKPVRKVSILWKILCTLRSRSRSPVLGGARRFEAFSPKLARRLTLYRRPALEQWILLEANPTVVTFCERPGYVQLDGHRRLADFWVRYVDWQELVLLDDSSRRRDEECTART
jgi:hypothetical protein